MKFNGIDFDTYFKHYPDAEGYFGKYGGCYIAPELQAAMKEITQAYFTICQSLPSCAVSAMSSRVAPPPFPIWSACPASTAVFSFTPSARI